MNLSYRLYPGVAQWPDGYLWILTIDQLRIPGWHEARPCKTLALPVPAPEADIVLTAQLARAIWVFALL